MTDRRGQGDRSGMVSDGERRGACEEVIGRVSGEGFLDDRRLSERLRGGDSSHDPDQLSVGLDRPFRCDVAAFGVGSEGS